jgi:hypothetical protein
MLALVRSIAERSGFSNPRFVAFHVEPVSPEVEKLAKRYLPSFELRDAAELGDAPSSEGQSIQRHAFCIRKMLVLGYPFGGPTCYLDSDIVCLSDITAMEQFRDMSVAPDFGRSFGIMRPEFYGGYLEFNTGVMVFEPSQRRLSRLLDFYRENQSDFTKGGDQPVINAYMRRYEPQNINMLHPCWNQLKRVGEYYPRAFRIGDVKLLHFVGDKPWHGDKVLAEHWRPFEVKKK